MKIILNKTDFLTALNNASKAVPIKTTMPILECFIIIANNETIKLISNNMEIAIECIIKGKIIEDGSIAINAKILFEIIRKLSDDEIIITVNKNNEVNICCEKVKFNISGKSTKEFPLLPKLEKNQKVQMSQFALKEIIRQTVFSISDSKTNKIMTGELFKIYKDQLKIISLDGHRISIRNINLKKSYESVEVNVPGKALNEISKILSGNTEDIVDIYFTEQHILFELDQTKIISRLIEGKFYKIEQMLSNDYETKFTINKIEFLNCIERASLLVKESEKQPLVFKIIDNYIELSMISSLGSMKEEIDIVKEGKDIIIGFNPKFLSDALKVIEDEEIDIYMNSSNAPCFIKDKEESYIYLILPINFNAGVN